MNAENQMKMEESVSRDSRVFKCSFCGKTFDQTQTRTMPFCSVRCQQLDLRNWLNEDYGMPVESGEDSADADENAED